MNDTQRMLAAHASQVHASFTSEAEEITNLMAKAKHEPTPLVPCYDREAMLGDVRDGNGCRHGRNG